MPIVETTVVPASLLLTDLLRAPRRDYRVPCDRRFAIKIWNKRRTAADKHTGRKPRYRGVIASCVLLNSKLMSPKNKHHQDWHRRECRHVCIKYFFRSASLQEEIVTVHCTVVFPRRANAPIRKRFSFLSLVRAPFENLTYVGVSGDKSCREVAFSSQSIDSAGTFTLLSQTIPSTMRVNDGSASGIFPNRQQNYWLSVSANSSYVIFIMQLKPLESPIDASIGVPREIGCLLSACCDNSRYTRLDARFPREKLLTVTSARSARRGAVSFFFQNIWIKPGSSSLNFDLIVNARREL